MKDSQILSAFQDAALPPAPARALVFDACHVGVILRAVLFVETVMAVGAMFAAAGAVWGYPNKSLPNLLAPRV